MKRTVEKDLSRIGVIDYALMTSGTCLAGYSGGMAINQVGISLFIVAGILVGACFSYLMRLALLRSPLLKLDGWLYTCSVIAAFTFGARLQGLMPEGGFPVDVIAAGWLSYMLIFGSFFTWQDSTLLFQAIPSIAMFGLVGCYDTFRSVTFAFFGFLLCLAMLFGRAHRRQMLRQAADSGYFTRGLAPGTPTPSVETTPGLADRMKAGPWRWIAGPEWALASAMVVVLVSLLGAPVIKQSMQAAGLSGLAKIQLPRSIRQRFYTPPPGMTEDFRGVVSVSNGPNTTLTSEPVLEVQMDRPRYLRMSSYDSFRGRGWGSAVRVGSTNPLQDVNAASLREMENFKEFDFAVRVRTKFTALPVPGIVTAWTGSPPVTNSLDGRTLVASQEAREPIHGRAAYVDYLMPQLAGKVRNSNLPVPSDAQRNVPSALAGTVQPIQISERTANLVREVTAGAQTDFEKAERIREAIASRITYNINADAVPSGNDVIDYVLFESQEGYCDVYATAMTAMARAAGIPSRYTVGYLPDPNNVDRSGNYVVLDRDLHAWAELYFKGFGWVIFDATDGANEVPGAGRGASNDQTPFWERAGVKLAIDSAIVLLALGAVGYWIYGRAAIKRKHTPQKELDHAYVAFARALERTSRVRRESSQTPDEYLSKVTPKLGEAAPSAEEVNRTFVRLMYSSSLPTDHDVAEIRKSVKNLSKMLKTVKNPGEKASPR